MVPQGEQLSGSVQAHLDPKLMWRDAEEGLELADEMERRNLHLARDIHDRNGALVLFP
jgi:hypothetical protein